MIRVYKKKIVVFSRNYKRTFIYSFPFNEGVHKWEDSNFGDVIFCTNLDPYKVAVKAAVKFIAQNILYAHCDHNKVTSNNSIGCSKCGKFMSYIEKK